MIRWLTTGLCALIALTAEASERCGTLSGAVVHLPDGSTAAMTVAWADGRLVATPDPRCPVHTFPDGAVLTPGLIAAVTQIGLVEVDLEPRTRHDTLGTDDLRVDVDVIDGYDPRSPVVPVTRLGGITSAVVVPGGGWISGSSAWVDLRTARVDEVTVLRRAAVELHPASMSSPAASVARLRALFKEAEFLRRATAERRLLLPADLSATGPELEALDRVLRGELPLAVHVDRASDLETLVRITREHRVRAIAVGASEGWLVADLLAEAGIGVVVNPYVYGAGSYDQRHGREDNAALLAAAGVKVAICGGSTHNARELRQLAGNAVRGGLSHADALAAITRVPAELFGSNDRGVIRTGAHADLAVWSGDPLEISSRLLLLVIDGEVQPLTSRQTELVEAWREVPRVRHLEE